MNKSLNGERPRRAWEAPSGAISNLQRTPTARNEASGDPVKLSLFSLLPSLPTSSLTSPATAATIEPLHSTFLQVYISLPLYLRAPGCTVGDRFFSRMCFQVGSPRTRTKLPAQVQMAVMPNLERTGNSLDNNLLVFASRRYWMKLQEKGVSEASLFGVGSQIDDFETERNGDRLRRRMGRGSGMKASTKYNQRISSERGTDGLSMPHQVQAAFAVTSSQMASSSTTPVANTTSRRSSQSLSFSFA